MQEVYNDGTLGERREIDLDNELEKLKQAIEGENVNHVNLFKEKQQEIIEKKLDNPLTKEEMESMIEKKVKEELNRRDILKEYNKLT